MLFFFSSRRRHTRWPRDWSSDVCSSDLLEADSVVVAAGAWSRELLAPLGIDLPVTPHRGQISHFELPDTDTAAWPVVVPRSSHYLLAFGRSEERRVGKEGVAGVALY